MGEKQIRDDEERRHKHSPSPDYSPFAIHHSLFAIHNSPFAIHHSPFAIHHSPFAIHHSLFAIHHSPLIRFGSKPPTENETVIASNSNLVLTLRNGSKNQPLTGCRRDLAIVLDGEIYIDTLKADLGLESSDPIDVITELYRRYASEAFQKLSGIYLLLLWDQVSETLYCARDRTGIYPAFYCLYKGSLTVSTSILELASLTCAKVDRIQLAEHLTSRWIDPDRTYYSGIYRIPSGSLLTYTQGRLSCSRYWRIFCERVSWASPEEISDYPKLFTRAVQRAIGGRQSAVLLSSGVDSVAVATAASAVKPDCMALSLGLSYKLQDDITIQRAVASRLGLKQQILVLEELLQNQPPLEALIEMTRVWPVPVQGLWTPAFYSLMALGKKAGCETILTGEGGDEYLGVGPSVAADMLLECDVRGIYRYCRSIHRFHHLSLWSIIKMVFWSFGLKTILRTIRNSITSRNTERLSARLKLPDWILPDPELRSEYIERCIEHKHRQEEVWRSQRSYYCAYGLLFQENPVTSLYFEQFFEIGARLGVHIRAPFMDGDLVDLLMRIPPRELLKDGWDKVLARKPLMERFPELGFDIRKKLLTDPLEESIADRCLQHLSSNHLSRLADLKIVDPNRFKTQAQALQIYYLKEALNLETWLSSR